MFLLDLEEREKKEGGREVRIRFLYKGKIKGDDGFDFSLVCMAFLKKEILLVFCKRVKYLFSIFFSLQTWCQMLCTHILKL